jgi:hypothetical protein
MIGSFFHYCCAQRNNKKQVPVERALLRVRPAEYERRQ